MIKLDIVSVGILEGTDSVILVLRAPELARLLPMEIGLLEARAITFEVEKVTTPRPLTHQLMANMIQSLGARVARAVIREFRDHTYYADLVLVQRGGQEVAIDARPSDAIALALRAEAPIFAAPAVLDENGLLEGEDEEEEPEGSGILH